MSRKFSWLIAMVVVSILVVGTSAFGQVSLTFEQLGEQLYNNKKLSLRKNQSCQTCHIERAGFADPRNKRNPELMPVSEGSATRALADDQVYMRIFGGRNAPSAAYAAYSPVMEYDEIEGLVIGGVFWDGRATGWTLGSPLAEQALGPFLNSVEMGMPLKAAVINDSQVCTDQVLMAALQSDPNCSTVCADGNIDLIYDCIGLAIAAYESTDFNDLGTVIAVVNKFSSKFDDWLAANPGLDPSTFGTDPTTGNFIGPGVAGTDYNTITGFGPFKAKGLALFNAANKGNCAACHITDNDPVAGKPVFTDFTYDNIGIPHNPVIDDLMGSVQPDDLGLGAQDEILRQIYDDYGILDPPTPEIFIAQQEGKFKVSSLRNIAKTPPYGHNGFFPTLESIVRFYNTRDILQCSAGETPVTPDQLAQGILPVPCWPPPEVPQNVNTDELGNLGLSASEEAAIVAFMKSLTDKDTDVPLP